VLQGRWHFSVAESEARDQCEIIGTEGRITINFFGDQILRLFRGEEAESIQFANPAHIQQPMIEQVVRYFCGEGDNPCSIEEARRVMALIDAFALPATARDGGPGALQIS